MKMKLRSPIFLLFFVFALSNLTNEVMGQSRDQSNSRRAWGYVFAGVGNTSGGNDTFINFGGGGEGLLYKGFGAGGEIGALTFTNGGNPESVGLASANFIGHFNRKGKVDPFITGGASLVFRSGAAGGGNIGGGVHWWVKNRLGVRFEFRDHIFSSDTPHFYVFRVGLSFR